MKKNCILVIVLILCIGFVSCERPVKEGEKSSKSAVVHNSKAQSIADDGLAQMISAANSDENPGKAGVRNGKVTVSGNTFPKTITIEYDGTPDILGIVREGTITGVLTNRIWLQGSILTINYDNYVVNGVQFKGTHHITNQATTLSNLSITFDVVISNVEIIEEGESGVWSGNHKWVWTLNETTVTGSTAGITQGGIPYETLITTPLVQYHDCPLVSKGIVEVTSGTYQATINYGDGTCDDKAIFTFNGKDTTITFFY